MAKYKKLSSELNDKLYLHERWLRGFTDGRRADLSKMDLSGYDFNNMFLTKANFLRSNLSGSNFYNAELSYCDMRYVVATETNFKNVAMYGAQLMGADLRNSSFSGAFLKCSNLFNAKLAGVSFHKVDASYVIVREGEWLGAITEWAYDDFIIFK